MCPVLSRIQTPNLFHILFCTSNVVYAGVVPQDVFSWKQAAHSYRLLQRRHYIPGFASLLPSILPVKNPPCRLRSSTGFISTNPSRTRLFRSSRRRLPFSPVPASSLALNQSSNSIFFSQQPALQYFQPSATVTREQDLKTPWQEMVRTPVQGLFGTQEFHRNHAGILQESVQFHKKNAGTEKISFVSNRPSDWILASRQGCQPDNMVTENPVSESTASSVLSLTSASYRDPVFTVLATRVPYLPDDYIIDGSSVSSFEYSPKISEHSSAQLANWIKTTSDHAEYYNEWVCHREHRTIALDGMAIRSQLFVSLNVDQHLCELAVRSLRNVISESSTVEPSDLVSRHFLSPDFAKFASIPGERVECRRLRCFFTGDHTKYDVGRCKMVVALGELEGAWSCYVWNFQMKRLTILDPSINDSKEKISKKHSHYMLHLHPILLRCMEEYCGIYTKNLFNWEIVLLENTEELPTRVGSGLLCLYFACQFNGNGFSTTPTQDSLEKFRNLLLCGMLKLPNNEGKPPSILAASV